MKSIKNLLFILFFSITINTNAQKAILAKADKEYDNYAYIDAIKTYERLAERGYKSADVFEKIANSYFFNADLNKAAKWYGRLIELKPDVDPEYYFRYANCLKAIGDAEKSAQTLSIYKEKSDNLKVKLYSKDINFLDKIEANSNRYHIKNININSPYSDYGSAFYNGKTLVFTSARDTSGTSNRKHAWTNQSFTDIYEAKLNGDSLIPSKPEKFSKKIQSKFNEASAIFTKDGKTMYFTRNNYFKGKRGRDENSATLIKIYKATFANNSWTKIVELPFNGNNWSTAHPALSPDEKFLYFASDRAGTLGGSDIFKAEIKTDGSYGIPINLGNKINTPGRETFPFISDENELYFASDTHSGLGGLDIFVADIDENDGTFGDVQNLGKEINSPKDDFAYLIDTKTRIGFFTSNRDGGHGFDDIYQFVENKTRIKPQIIGYITDVDTQRAIENAKVSLYNQEQKLIDSTYSDKQGKYSFNVQTEKSYTVTAIKMDYNKNGKTITIPKYEMINKLNIDLGKNNCKLVIGGDLAKCFGISMIYFDLDKANIRDDAAEDLAKILDVMRQYPKLKIDIRSHTDSRASFLYNEDLSDRRAKATRMWLISKGIKPSRLTAKGYGEYRLVNKCRDNVPCTEEQHQQNRRSEFIITNL